MSLNNINMASDLFYRPTDDVIELAESKGWTLLTLSEISITFYRDRGWTRTTYISKDRLADTYRYLDDEEREFVAKHGYDHYKRINQSSQG